MSTILIPISIRNLMRNKTRTLLSALGIIIGIFAICTLGMAGAAFTEGVDDLVEKNANLLMIAASSEDENNPQYNYMASNPTLSENDVYRMDQAVKAVTPDYTLSPLRIAIRPLEIDQNNEFSGVYMFGDKDKLEVLIGTELIEGHLPRLDTDILILSSIADKYNLRVGNTLKTTTESGREISLKITGIVDDSLLSTVYSLTLNPNIILVPDELYNIIYDSNVYGYSDNSSYSNYSSQLSNFNNLFSSYQTTDSDDSDDTYIIEPSSISISNGTNHLNIGYMLYTNTGGTLNINISKVIDESNLNNLRRTQNIENSKAYDYVMIRLDDLSLRAAVQSAIEREMNGDRRDTSDDRIYVRDLTALVGDLQEILSMAIKLGVAVSAIALIVASVSITNIMIISVQERKHEIGLMRSIGTKRRQIVQMFLFETGIIGLFGSIIGVLVSLVVISVLLLLILHSISYLLIPAVWMYIPLGIVIGIIVCLISGLYPAIKAAHLNPVEAMER